MSSVSFASIRLGQVLHASFFAALLALIVAWCATALSVHISGFSLIAAYGALGVAVIAAFAALRVSRARAWGALVLILALCVGWYQTLHPRADRDWAFDVAHGAHARLDGHTVHIDNVRNFEWTSSETAHVSWEARAYDLDELVSVDLVTSVWDSEDIAHIIVSFGFENDQRVAFSVETRREQHESFNVVGGFFRQFELVLIAATEDDILKLRTNHRQEDVRLYPIALNDAQRRALFLFYVELANRLQNTPAFYNTLTQNCTTTLYPLAHAIHPAFVPDWRLLMSGHLPSYIDELGGFEGDLAMEERVERAAITQVALQVGDADYSRAVRQVYDAK